jgi:hypothetical protein
MSMDRLNWRFIVAFTLSVLAPFVVWWTGVNPRAVSAVLGIIAAAVLGYVFFAYYRATPMVARALLVLTEFSLVVTAIAQTQVARGLVAVPLTFATYPSIAHRAGCILLGLFWGRLLSYGTRTPWVHRREGDREG